MFTFDDVSRGAHNDAKGVTDEAVIRLAHLCPNLKYVQLQGTSGLGDSSLTAFFQHCPKLLQLEITEFSSGSMSTLRGTAFDALRENPDWAPKLKKLRVASPEDAQVSDRQLMKPMRALSKEREKLLIQLVTVRESKKWGDWELEVMWYDYRNGRKQPTNYNAWRTADDIGYVW